MVAQTGKTWRGWELFMSDLFHVALVHVWNLTKVLENGDKPEDRALVEDANIS